MTTESLPIPFVDGYLLRVDIWEKGNVGITDLSGKLHLCLKQALCDYILELYFLPQPIARIDDTLTVNDSPIQAVSSPFVVLEPSPTRLLRQESKEEDPDSPRRTLFEKGEIRVPSSLSFTSPRRPSLDSLLSPATPALSEPHRSRSDTNTITHMMDNVLQSLETSERNDAIEKDKEPTESSGVTWQEKEKNRRELEVLDAYQKEAFHGRQGILEDTYSNLIPKHLRETWKLSSRSVSHYTFPLLGSYSAELFLNEALGIFNRLSPDLFLSTFKLDADRQYSHYTLQKTSRPRVIDAVAETKFIVVGRNLKQWDEARSPGVLEIRLTQVLRTRAYLHACTCSSCLLVLSSEEVFTSCV